MHFRLMTYNIHKGIGGVDRRYRPDRIIETIAHCSPDIVLLQEVDDGVPRSRYHKQVDLLATHHQPGTRITQIRTRGIHFKPEYVVVKSERPFQVRNHDAGMMYLHEAAHLCSPTCAWAAR